MIPAQYCPFGRIGQQPADQLLWQFPRLISGQLRLPEAQALTEETTA